MTTTVTVTVAAHEVIVTEMTATEGEQGHAIAQNTVVLSVTGQTRQFYAHAAQKIIVEETSKAARGHDDSAGPAFTIGEGLPTG